MMGWSVGSWGYDGALWCRYGLRAGSERGWRRYRTDFSSNAPSPLCYRESRAGRVSFVEKENEELRKMYKGVLRTAAVLACSALIGCGDVDTTGPSVDRGEVAGVYHLAALTFDPQGSLPKTDIMSRLAPADRPELVLSRSDDTFQSITRDPDSGRIIAVEGTYTPLTGLVRLRFKKAADADRLLLPQRAEFDFDKTAMTLSYHANTAVSLARLRELVPEYRTEQLPDPVLGALVLVFTLDRR